MNEALPFPKLVEALGLARDVSQNPLFQVMFSFHDSVIPHPRFGRAWSTVFERGNGSSKVDLDVVVIPHAQRHLGDHERGDDRVTFLWEFNRDLFERSTVERMAGQFMRLLEAAVAEPDTELRRLPLVSDDDRAKLLGDRAPSADAAEPSSVAEHVIARAVERPDAVAVSDDSGDVRYGELVKRAYRLAQWLASRGAHAERTVAVCLPRGADLVAAELGILLSGAAFVPLDPEDPPERAHGILTDAGALCVVTDGAHAGRFPPALPSVSMETFASQEAPESLPSPSRRGERRKAPRKDPEAAQLFEAAAALARASAKTALAYVIYTSGSTGRPKGVMVEHASFDGFVAWHRKEFALDARSRTTMVYAPSFDSSLAEIWPALSAGARVVVVPPDVRLSPERLAAWLVAERVTFTDLPTPLVERLLAIPWPKGGHLRAMAVGGDRLHARPRADHPFLLFNEYGPTEATVTATSGRVTPERVGEEDVLPSIGRPIDGARAYVLDEHLAPAPVGAPGELYLGGRGVARGYLNQPQLTKERFLRDPFADEPGARMYRTGDRARWLGDGRLQFCGRADDQLKIRGHRIEPAEIVAALAAHPSVATAHVGPERGPSGEIALVAYVVPSPGAANLVAETLRRYAAARLPTFMRPAAYVLLDALPLTSRGKVDVHALPPPAWGGDAAPSRARAETSTERAIESSWKEALGLADVGVEDNFFDVGGNSLLLAAVHQAVERELDRKFPLLWLFEHPTIRALAMHLDGAVVEESFASPSERRIALPGAQRANNLERLQRRRRIPATEESGDA